MSNRLALNSQHSACACFCLLRVEIKGMHCHTWWHLVSDSPFRVFTDFVYTWMILSSTPAKCLKNFSNTRYTLQFFTAVGS